MSGLRRRGLQAMPTFHLVELLDASIRNVPVSSLLPMDRTAVQGARESDGVSAFASVSDTTA
jgi:hypothetical protein